jgi:hypothetical protein
MRANLACLTEEIFPVALNTWELLTPGLTPGAFIMPPLTGLF